MNHASWLSPMGLEVGYILHLDSVNVLKPLGLSIQSLSPSWLAVLTTTRNMFSKLQPLSLYLLCTRLHLGEAINWYAWNATSPTLFLRAALSPNTSKALSSFRALSDCSTSRRVILFLNPGPGLRWAHEGLPVDRQPHLKCLYWFYDNSFFKTIGSAHLVLWALESPSEPHALRSSGYAGGRLFLRIMSGSPNCRVF